MKKVALYVRVSTARQDQEGYSIPLQKERLIAYCKAKGWAVAGVFVDPGHSGSSLDRPGISQLVDGVEAGDFDVVLVYKLDRLSRSQKDTLFLIEDVFMANDVDFVSMQESFDTTTIYGRAMVGILSVFAQMERETIAERTLMGRSGRAEEGYWHGGGTEPIGYKYVDGLLQICPDEAPQVRQVYELFAAGFSVSEISRRMDGFQTKHGDWSHTSTICNVLDNPLYSGTVHFDGVRSSGKHDAIVSKDLDSRVKSRRERLRRVDAFGDSAYLLTGLLFCDCCGARYFAHKRPNGKVVYSCHSRAKKNKKMIKDPSCKAPHIPVEKLEALVESELLRLAASPDLVYKHMKKTADDGGSGEEVKRGEELRRVDLEISKLMDELQHAGHESVGDIAGRIVAAHKERESLNHGVVPSKPKVKTDFFMRILADVADLWKHSDIRAHRSFLFQLFDGIHIGAGDVRVVSSVPGLWSSSPLNLSKNSPTLV